MIETIETKTLHKCDICERRIPKPVKNCKVCNKEVCQYCRLKMTTTKRKYPDSGYLLRIENLGYLCKKCSIRLMKIKV